VISGTGLNPDAGLKQPTTGTWRNADAGLTFFPAFRHLLITAEVSWFSSSLDCSARTPQWVGWPKIERNPSLLYSKPQLLCSLLSYDAPYLVTLHTAKLYTAPYWATLHPTELLFILFWAPLYPLSYGTLHPRSCAAPHWATPAFYWAITHPTELHCNLLSYDAACWASISHPTEPCCTLLNYAAPFEQCCTPIEPRDTLLSYASPYWATLDTLSCAAPYWA
jgi:hypothetical protein